MFTKKSRELKNEQTKANKKEIVTYNFPSYTGVGDKQKFIIAMRLRETKTSYYTTILLFLFEKSKENCFYNNFSALKCCLSCQ